MPFYYNYPQLLRDLRLDLSYGPGASGPGPYVEAKIS